MLLLLVGCSQGPPADAGEHCVNAGHWKCYRDLYAGRTSMAEYDSCLAAIMPMCSGVAWPAGCAPTQAESDACVASLSSAESASVPTAELLAMYDDCELCP